MKRPLLIYTISLCLGIMSAFFLDSSATLLFLIIIIYGASIYTQRKFILKKHIVLGIAIFYTLGAIEYSFISKSIENKFSQFTDKQVTITGFISEEPEISSQKVKYIIKTKQISCGNFTKNINGKILVFTKLKENKIYTYGQQLEIEGILNRPQEERNPGGFDYRKHLAGSGISGVMFVNDYSFKLLNHTKYNVILKLGLTLRDKIIRVVNESLPEEQAGLLNGMLIGYRDGLGENVQDAFSDAGLTHIMAVSGANIAFIIFPLVFLFKKLRIRQSISNSIIIFILVLFVCITGFSPSVVRAVIMAVAVLFGQIIMRETEVFTSISFAAMVLVLYSPYVLFDIGFQLSFGATLGLVLFYKTIKEKLNQKFIPAFLVDLLAVTLAAQIGVLPLTAYYFNKISIISVFSNIFAVPLTGLITILGFVMVIVGQISLILAYPVALINNTLLTFILYVTKISSGLPFAVLKVITPGKIIVILYYLIILFVMWYKPKYKPDFKFKPGSIAIIALTFLILFISYNLIPGKLEVVFVDVGQGDCTLVKSSAGKTVLIDGGGIEGKDDTDNNIGETTVIPFLYDYGVSKLDMVIATHGHGDHIQGLIPVLKEMRVGKLIIPDTATDSGLKKITSIAQSRKIPVYKCIKGNVIKLDDKTYFEVIHPYKGFEIDKSSSNNCSLVIKLFYKKTSIIFTGDIEKEVESVLVQEKADLKADVLKVAHHGSPYSTTGEFLDRIKPSAAVISVGKNNFGHPDEVIIDRMKGKGIKLFRTDESGAIILKSDGKKITVKKTIGE